MNSRVRSVLGWIPALLVVAMHVLGLYGKLVPPAPGSAGDLFAIQVGMRGLEYPLAIVELITVILFLIPRTSTVGFVLMVGYTGGILAAMLSHGFGLAGSSFIIVLLALLALSAWFRNPELVDRLLKRGAYAQAPVLTRTQKWLAWMPAVLLGLFLIIASGAPKVFLAYPGSSLEPFATALGIWDGLLIFGILEIAITVLFLVPRTSTVGFILLIGWLGGALATGLTHPEVKDVMPAFPFIMMLMATFSAYFRNPELLARLMKRPTAMPATVQA